MNNIFKKYELILNYYDFIKNSKFQKISTEKNPENIGFFWEIKVFENFLYRQIFQKIWETH